MTFNETVFMKTSFTKDDFMVYISGPRNVYSFEFDVVNLYNLIGTTGGFSTLEIEITYKDSGQFFGLDAEAIVFAVRNGANFYNYRGGLL